MTLPVKNIFADLPAHYSAEEFLTLFEGRSVRIERIVSRGQSSPAGFWYDQAQEEWVMVLRGDAALEFASGEIVEMAAGDYLAIPRHVKHRVARTSDETIWLALHVS